uniref:Uncharacterized protein n=1 Tax=Anguilla anguilla TaxID=7936 RepID=A0A0E9V5C0_ANGAN
MRSSSARRDGSSGVNEEAEETVVSASQNAEQHRLVPWRRCHSCPLHPSSTTPPLWATNTQHALSSVS